MSGLKRTFSDITNLGQNQARKRFKASLNLKKLSPNKFAEDLSKKIKETIDAHLNLYAGVSDENHNESLYENNNIKSIHHETVAETLFIKKIFKERKPVFSTSNHNEAEKEMPGLFFSFFELILDAFNSKSELLISHFKELAVQTLEPSFMGLLVGKLVKNYAIFKSSQPINDLIRLRIEWLNNECLVEPVKTWHMPNAKIHGHYLVEEFLKSGREKQRYNIGTNRERAKQFCETYSGVGENYSCLMIPLGAGANAYVDMVKTGQYFESFLVRHQELLIKYKKEIQELNGYLNNLDN